MLILGCSILSLPVAKAWEDPVGDEIQARMQEAERQTINEQIREMNEASPWSDDADSEGYGDEPAYSEAEWVDWARGQNAPKINDPAYQAFLDGEWIYKAPARQGDTHSCAVMFMRNGVGAMLIGTGGLDDMALFAFFGPGIPAPRDGTVTRATLSQSNEPPAQVTVYNAASPWIDGSGLVVFAVPSAKLAVEGMLDNQSFGIAMSGHDVANIAWHSGLDARDRLQQCLISR